MLCSSTVVYVKTWHRTLPPLGAGLLVYTPNESLLLTYSAFATAGLRDFQELFRDESKTEFVVVTIPSVLAVAETERLVAQLREQVRTDAVAMPPWHCYCCIFRSNH